MESMNILQKTDMQELEKTLLKETEQLVNMHYEDDSVKTIILRNLRDIRKHMCGKDTGAPTNDGWIPVEERLPKAGEHVLVSFRSAGFLPATAIISENGRWSMLQGAKGFNDVTENVIAWGPLPEPYRPKKESEGSRRLRKREEFFKE